MSAAAPGAGGVGVARWHLGRLGVLDTETTAPDPEDARTVTACIGAVGGGEPVQVVQRLANPGVEIPQGAIDVHGITNEHAVTNGLDPAVVVGEVVNWLEDWWAAGLPVVAFNACYDLTVIDRDARRHIGRPLDTSAALVIDPFVIDRRLDKYRKGKRTLTAMCEQYDVRLEGAHDATADAVAAARVAYRLAQRWPRLAAMTLTDLHEAQARWHALGRRGRAVANPGLPDGGGSSMTPMERAMRPVNMGRSSRPHPIEKMVGYDPAGGGHVVTVVNGNYLTCEPLSDCTDAAVRTHVPVEVDGLPVLIPMADADRIMRDIAAAVWPGDPSPLEEDGYVAGHRPVLEAVEILAPGERDDPARWQVEQALDVLDPTGTERRFVAFLTDASPAAQLSREQLAERLADEVAAAEVRAYEALSADEQAQWNGGQTA